MADNLQGFNDELANNAVNAAQRIGEIQDAVRSLRRVLQGETVSTTKEFTDLTASANKFKSLQEKAAKSGKELNKLYQEQSKIHDTITRLSAKIQIANEKAFAASGKQRKNLEKQAEALMHMRDEAKQISNYYEQLVQSTTKLDKSSAYFTQLSKVVDKIPILNKFQKPFEKAAEAARKTAIEAKRAQQISATVEKRVDKNGKEYYVDLVKGGRTSKTNFLQDKAKVDEAAVASKKSPFTAGMKAIGSEMGEGMSGLVKGGGWIALLVGAIKFIVELMLQADKTVVDIARNLSISKDSARGIQEQFADLSAKTNETYVNVTNLVAAQSALTDQLQIAGRATNETLKAQTFLTERMKMQASDAAVITARSEAFGENSEQTLKTIINTNKSLTPNRLLLSQIVKISGQIAASFQYSNVAIAKGIEVVNKYGLTLDKAKNISESLLNFESSIGDELEAELLTGKEFNLEKARALAVTGDMASATEEVMKQMESLTAEQRKSPIIMKTFSNLLGISADEIADAYQLEHNRTRQNQELLKIMQEQGLTEAENYRAKMGLEQATFDQAKKTVTLEEQYKEAVTKVKDQFVSLVSGGYLDKLSNAIKEFATWIAKYTGDNEKTANEQAKAAQTTLEKGLNEKQKAAQTTLGKGLNEKQKATLEKLRVQAGGETSGWFRNDTDREIGSETWALVYKLGIDYEDARDMIEAEAATKLQEIKEGKRTINAKTGKTETKVKDFIIKPLNEDTITMAGGTKLGGNVEALLKELILEVKAGRNIYLGTQKVNEALGLSLNALG